MDFLYARNAQERIYNRILALISEHSVSAPATTTTTTAAAAIPSTKSESVPSAVADTPVSADEIDPASTRPTARNGKARSTSKRNSMCIS
jgi:hypothetical protein